MPSTIFDRLREEAGIEVPERLRYYPYSMTYDIEALLRRDPTLLPDATETTEYVNRHELVSVSVASNVPGYRRARCIVRKDGEDVETCVGRFVDYLLKIAEEAERRMLIRFRKTLK